MIRFFIFFSVAVAAASFSGTAFSDWNGTMQIITPPQNSSWLRIYEPPARKSVLVDAQGLAQRTADNMQLVPRDRSRETLVPRGGRRIENIPVRVSTTEARAVRVDAAAEPAAEREIRLEGPRRLSEPGVGAYGDSFFTEADRALVEDVRTQILGREELLVTALNVRLHARHGRLTLDGVVNHPSERRMIADIASKRASRSAVRDGLKAAS